MKKPGIAWLLPLALVSMLPATAAIVRFLKFLQRGRS